MLGLSLRDANVSRTICFPVKELVLFFVFLITATDDSFVFLLKHLLSGDCKAGPQASYCAGLNLSSHATKRAMKRTQSV